MRNIYITFLFLIFCSMAYAQEQAKYRVTYDCDAQVVTGKTNTYRWTLDIGETTAVFYNNNYRLYSSELAKVKAQGDDNAMIDQLPVISGKYFPKNDLQIVVGSPDKGGIHLLQAGSQLRIEICGCASHYRMAVD